MIPAGGYVLWIYDFRECEALAINRVKAGGCVGVFFSLYLFGDEVFESLLRCGVCAK